MPMYKHLLFDKNNRGRRFDSHQVQVNFFLNLVWLPLEELIKFIPKVILHRVYISFEISQLIELSSINKVGLRLSWSLKIREFF